jgi:hypothetical protein
MVNTSYSSSFHIVASLSNSPTSFEVSLYFIYNFVYLIEFMSFVRVHLNNCSLNFVGS